MEQDNVEKFVEAQLNQEKESPIPKEIQNKFNPIFETQELSKHFLYIYIQLLFRGIRRTITYIKRISIK